MPEKCGQKRIFTVGAYVTGKKSGIAPYVIGTMPLLFFISAPGVP
jgi:hypothetical protein